MNLWQFALRLKLAGLVLLCHLSTLSFAEDAYPPFLIHPQMRPSQWCRELLSGMPVVPRAVRITDVIDRAEDEELPGHWMARTREVVDLWDLWAYAIRQVRFRRVAGRPVQIFNFASGLGEESHALQSFFSTGKFLEVDPQRAHVLSIDQQFIEIFGAQSLQAEAKEEHPAWGLPFAQAVQFICGDLTNDNTFQKLPYGTADFIFMRHPQVGLEASGVPKYWVPIFDQLAKRLRPGGFAVLTFYIEEELRAAFATLKKSPLFIVEAGRNMFSTNGFDDAFFIILSQSGSG